MAMTITIEDDQAAFVMSPDGKQDVYLPDGRNLPEHLAAAVAAFMLLDNANFRAGCLDWLDEQIENSH